MKGFGIISLFITLCIIGYLMMKQSTGGEAGPSADRAQAMEQKARDAMAAAGQSGVRGPLQAQVEAFHTEKQRYPQSLDELKDSGYISEIPPNVDYDPATGEVKERH